MGVAASQSIYDACGGGSESMVVEHGRAEGESGKIVESEDGLDIVLLQDTCIEDFLGARTRLLFGLEDEDDIFPVRQRDLSITYPFSQLKKHSGVAVVSATMSDRKGIDIASDGYCGMRLFVSPHSNHTETSHMGEDLVGMAGGKLAHYQVMGVMLIARNAGMAVQFLPYGGIVGHL